MSKWISVEDRLPEDRRTVLVTAYWHETYQVMMGSYYGDGLWWCVPFNNTGQHEQKLKPKAWMELPKAYCESENDFGAEQICEKMLEVLNEEALLYETRSGLLFHNNDWRWQISQNVINKFEKYKIYIEHKKRKKDDGLYCYGIKVNVDPKPNSIALVNAKSRIFRNVYAELIDE
jgi:hypothetical protein